MHKGTIEEMQKIALVKSYKTFLKYLNIYSEILKPIVKGAASGKRYYIAEENLKEFVRKFENSELS